MAEDWIRENEDALKFKISNELEMVLKPEIEEKVKQAYLKELEDNVSLEGQRQIDNHKIKLEEEYFKRAETLRRN